MQGTLEFTWGFKGAIFSQLLAYMENFGQIFLEKRANHQLKTKILYDE
jgi:hypothetical protein